jgi:hypothetical protein
VVIWLIETRTRPADSGRPGRRSSAGPSRSWPAPGRVRYLPAVPYGGSGRRRDDVARSDRRWLVLVTVVFLGSLVGLFCLRVLYHATGPHPEITTFVRRVKLYANRLVRSARPRK